MEQIQVDKILEIIREEIKDWHKENENKEQDFKITEDMNQTYERNAQTDDFYKVVRDLITTHTYMWHGEDQTRKNNDNKIVAAVSRYLIKMNIRRTNLFEELDEIVLEMASKAKEEK